MKAIERAKCKIFKQVLSLFLMMGLGSSAFAGDILSFYQLNHFNQSRVRGPAMFAADDSIEPSPLTQKIWLQKVIVEDEAGIVSQVRSEMNHWEEVEEYRELWDLESTGLYNTPSMSTRKTYLNGKLLKYADRRLAGEVKKADKGSTLYTVGQAQKTLTPQTEVSIAPSVKFKFRARIIEGLGVMKVENPYVKYETQFTFNGRVLMTMSKRIDSLGVDTQINYKVDEGLYTAFVDKKLSSTVTTRLSATQPDDHLFFTEDSDNRLELFYSNSF